MTPKLYIILFVAFLLLTMGFTEPESRINVMSFNIRYDNPQDGKHAWDHRKERVSNLIHFYQPAVFGMQEVLHHQLTYLEEQFPEYKRVGVGRDDGREEGEYSPIFYHTGTFELLDQGTFWLSRTPEKPSKDWDAALPRIASWALLRHSSTQDTLLFCNTHFDHRGKTARQESAKLLQDTLPQMAGNHPLVLTGDFNSEPASEAYKYLVEGSSFQDAYEQSQLPPIGPQQSFGGFEVTPELPGQRIDYIFVSDQVQVHRFATISEEQGGSYPSDHFPVFAEISW